jgi:hypothetical protein
MSSSNSSIKTPARTKRPLRLDGTELALNLGPAGLVNSGFI